MKMWEKGPRGAKRNRFGMGAKERRRGGNPI